MAYRRIRFRNLRIQNSDARLVFEERNFFHITPVLRATPPHFYTFEAPSPPLHISISSHFYCFPSNTTSTTFHCPPPPPTHTHVHTHYQHISIVFHPPPPPHFVCLPCTTPSTTILLFSVHYLHHHLISIVFHPQPPTHFYGFSCATFTTFLFFPCTTTSTTFLLFSIYHHDHLSVVFHPPP